jgi:hypothetical protein
MQKSCEFIYIIILDHLIISTPRTAEGSDGLRLCRRLLLGVVGAGAGGQG